MPKRALKQEFQEDLKVRVDEKPEVKRKRGEEWRKIKEVEDFRNQMLADKRSNGTIKQYTSMVYRFLYWMNKDPRKVKTEDLERYKAYLAIEKEAAKTTIYINIKSLQAFFEFLGMDVAKDVRPPKRPGSLPKYLNEEEVWKMFEAVAADKFNGKRDLAILSVLAYTGLRVSELTHLDIEDIDFNDKTLRVRAGKGDKDRIVIFEENTEKAIRDHLKDPNRQIAKKESGALFVSSEKRRIETRTVEYMIKGYAKKAGIQKTVTPHVLRHTMATALLKRGADIRIIQQLLGHSSIATTQIYTHVDQHMLRTVYSKSKPKYREGSDEDKDE